MIKNQTSEEPKTKMIKTSNVGVYFRECLTNGKKDKAFYFTFEDIATNKKVWVKVGKYSEGIRENATVTLRSEAISKNRHGEDITVQAKKKLKNITTFDEIANEYTNIDPDESKFPSFANFRVTFNVPHCCLYLTDIMNWG